MKADEIAIVIVGVCGSGKSTLSRGLCEHGYRARPCAQEHSYVPALWRRHGRPTVLICLDASPEIVNRRLHTSWNEKVLAVQRERLADAREHCDLYIDTDPLTVDEVLAKALAYLRGLAGNGGATARQHNT